MTVRGSAGVSTTGVDATLNFGTVQDGDWVLLPLIWSNTALTAATPDGWTVLKPVETSGSRRNILFGKVWHTGDPTSVTVTLSGTTTKAMGILWGSGGPTAIGDFVIGASRLRNTIGASPRTQNIAPSIAVPDNTQVIVISQEATSLAESPNTILGVDNGFTQVFYQPQDAIAIETIWFGERVVTPAGASGDTTISYRNPQDNNGWAVQIGLPGVEVPPPDPIPGFDNVFQMIRRGGCTWAHRGGSTNWPEMSEYAYDQAVLAGYPALEFSAQRTSDGVWVGCHDIDLNRTSQTTGLPNISTMTWAQVQTYMNSLNSAGTPRPYYRLIDFLDKFTPTHVCIVDPKNAVSFKDEFLALCDAHGGPSRIVQKFFGVGAGSIAYADAARLKGYQAWGYYYEADYLSGALAENQSHWSILGMNINAPQAAWDAVLSYGKPVVGHIATTQAMYDTAIANGADIVQCANVAGIAAVGREDTDHLVEYDGTDLTPVELVEWDGTFLKATRIMEKS